MAITSFTSTRHGRTTRFVVVSSLTAPFKFYWYVDGVHAYSTAAGEFWLSLPDTAFARVEVLDSANPNFDALANAPVEHTARRVIEWVASTDPTIAHYRVEQRRAAEPWIQIASVRHAVRQWSYRTTTPRLDDLTDYEWRVVPMDAAGNDGAVVAKETVRVVRRPDPPMFTATYSAATTRVTLAAA